MDIAEPADRQWETDLVELFGLDFATAAYAISPSRRSSPALRIFFLLIVGAVLAGSIPVFLLSQRLSVPKAIVGGSAVAGRHPAAIVPASSLRQPGVLLGDGDKASTSAEKPSSRRSSTSDNRPGAVASVSTRQQPLVSLSAKPERSVQTSRTYAYGRERVRRHTANGMAARHEARAEYETPSAVSPVSDPSTVALPSTNASRSDLQTDHSLANRAASAMVDPGAGSSSATSRQVPLPGAEPNTGLLSAGSSVQTMPGFASSDKVGAKTKSRRRAAIDALRLLRRQ